jgi:hypothetical protein
MTCKETWPQGKGSPKDCVGKILAHHKIANTEYRFGKTKVFIRNPTTVCVTYFYLYKKNLILFHRHKNSFKFYSLIFRTQIL